MSMKRDVLAECAQEPIHVPGAILPHGALLAFDCESFSVVQAAGATERLLGQPVATLLRRTAEQIFDSRQAAQLRELGAQSSLLRPRLLLDPIFRVAQPVDASICRSGTVLIVEFESAESDRFHGDPLLALQEMFDAIDERTETVETLCRQAAERVRHTSGFDRVMVYQFQPDDSGRVIAESRIDTLESYLGLNYPASDIPAQARALYLKNSIRVIPSIDYQPAPLVPPVHPETGRPLDMSQASLRTVSPVHLEYLANMGVAASMSISIILRGRLWGLIACHHYSPRFVPKHLRAAYELFGGLFSLYLESQQNAAMVTSRAARESKLRRLIAAMRGDKDFPTGLREQATELLSYIRAGGAAVLSPPLSGLALRLADHTTTMGRTPGHEHIIELSEWIGRQGEPGKGVFATDRLGELWRPAGQFVDVGAGVLAISVSHERPDFIMWFRPEVTQTVLWGGDPAKPVTTGPAGSRLTPRASFEAWKQTVRGRSEPWTQIDIEAAEDLRVVLLETVLRHIEGNVRLHERERQRDALLLAELNHRLKNTLATIQALITQSSRGATAIPDFVARVTGRIASLARAHSLLTDNRWSAISIRTLAAQELDQHRRDAQVVSIDGPEVVLRAEAGLALGLALHELATNATKYGALSAAQGRVALSWQADPASGIQIHWHESGGPPVQTPRRRGFGSTLIERALAMDTGGEAKLIFATEGVQCEIFLPPTSIAPGEMS